jgi:L-lactate dehydrogenase complex protein LldF
MSLFRNNIRKAIADEALQTALDKNAAQRLVARDSAYKGASESFESLKQRAHAMREATIADLEAQVEKFIQKAKGNGFIIHRAANAAEARSIILEIAKSRGAKLISKSKTMMSEEIDLNQALEDAGIDVVETDLGEYIVQLREEHPSHIITPAVHLRKEDVGETFHQKLGIPLTDDIQILTNTARARLRQKFLDTDIGISGVNMGVVETGEICIVTNEGNGRMVTTLPEVHIALMGIERLVPDLEGLSLIVKMLPRSATGQQITVYTQLISGPRRANEHDGAQERHIVLIDNGRRALSQTSLSEALFCIRCGACINACPVFREIGGYSYTSKSGDYTPYPGPIGSVLSPGLFGQGDFGHLAQASTLCGACKEACPMDIDLPTMLLRVRSGEVKVAGQAAPTAVPADIPAPVSMGLKTFTWASTRPRLFKAAQKLAAAAGKIWSPRTAWMTLPTLTGWGYSKDFPRPAIKTFRDRWNTGGISKTHLSWGVEGIKDVSSIPNEGVEDSVKQLATPVERFEAELKALDGKFIACNQDELEAKILALLKDKGVSEIMSWEANQLPEGLAEGLQNQGISMDFKGDPAIKVGLTGAQAAIAETGTLVLASGPGRPGSTSLLPEVHIAVLHEKDIYYNLPQVLKLQEIREAASVALISGPSRTADIEMTLTIGVHGPGEVFVFLCGGLGQADNLE